MSRLLIALAILFIGDFADADDLALQFIRHQLTSEVDATFEDQREILRREVDGVNRLYDENHFALNIELSESNRPLELVSIVENSNQRQAMVNIHAIQQVSDSDAGELIQLLESSNLSRLRMEGLRLFGTRRIELAVSPLMSSLGVNSQTYVPGAVDVVFSSKNWDGRPGDQKRLRLFFAVYAFSGVKSFAFVYPVRIQSVSGWDRFLFGSGLSNEFLRNLAERSVEALVDPIVNEQISELRSVLR